jgi:hypothetical protein
MDTLFGSVAQLLRQPEFFKEKYEFFKKVASINQPASSPQLAQPCPKPPPASVKPPPPSAEPPPLFTATAAVHCNRRRRHHSYLAITAILRIVATIITANAASY